MFRLYLCWAAKNDDLLFCFISRPSLFTAAGFCWRPKARILTTPCTALG